MKKNMVIIASRGIGDLIFHLPLLRSLYESYEEKLIIISNKVNRAKEIYRYEKFHKEIIYFDNTRFPFIKTLRTILALKKLINGFNLDQIILTDTPRRLMAPVYLSNAKKKIIFGQGKYFFSKDKKYNNLIYSHKIMQYTNDLNLPIKNNNFFLLSDNFDKDNKTEKNKLKIFISIDSHHDHNNWGIENYIKIILKLLHYNINIFINFAPSKIHFLDKLPKDVINSNKVNFTYNKSILEIINIINMCRYIVGNESGPICLGASLQKEVHSIYLPIHTPLGSNLKPASEIINKKNFYYNAEEESNDAIIEKITNCILKNIN